MSRFRVSYGFQKSRMCRKDELAQELRELTYPSSWERIPDPSWIKIIQIGTAYELSWPVVITREHEAATARDAVRTFLYTGALPDEIDFNRLVVVELGEVPLDEDRADEAAA